MDCQNATVFVDEEYYRAEAHACWMDRRNREDRVLAENPLYRAALVEGCREVVQDLYPLATDVEVSMAVDACVVDLRVQFYEETLGVVHERITLGDQTSLAAAYRIVVRRLVQP